MSQLPNYNLNSSSHLPSGSPRHPNSVFPSPSLQPASLEKAAERFAIVHPYAIRGINSRLIPTARVLSFIAWVTSESVPRGMSCHRPPGMRWSKQRLKRISSDNAQGVKLSSSRSLASVSRVLWQSAGGRGQAHRRFKCAEPHRANRCSGAVDVRCSNVRRSS